MVESQLKLMTHSRYEIKATSARAEPTGKRDKKETQSAERNGTVPEAIPESKGRRTMKRKSEDSPMPNETREQSRNLNGTKANGTRTKREHRLTTELLLLPSKNKRIRRKRKRKKTEENKGNIRI